MQVADALGDLASMLYHVGRYNQQHAVKSRQKDILFKQGKRCFPQLAATCFDLLMVPCSHVGSDVSREESIVEWWGL